MVDPAMFPQELVMATTNIDPAFDNRQMNAAVVLLWLMFVNMLVGAIVFAALSRKVPPPKRMYHYITTTILSVSAIAYFSMALHAYFMLKYAALHDPQIPKDELWQRIGRETYWARSIDWMVSFPLTTILLDMIAGLDLATAFATIVSTLIMVACSGGGHRDLFLFPFSIMAYLLIAVLLFGRGRSLARKRGDAVAKFYTQITVFTMVIWLGYLLVWVFAGYFGRAFVNVPAYIAAFAILDTGAKSAVGAWLLYTYAKVPDLAMSNEEHTSTDEAREGQIRLEE